MAQQVKDLVLSLLWLRFEPWPGNFCVPWVLSASSPQKKWLSIEESHSIILPRAGYG